MEFDATEIQIDLQLRQQIIGKIILLPRIFEKLLGRY